MTQWAVLVPVKRLAVAKTRLALPVEQRAQLALAMATDVVAAAMSVPGVTVIVLSADEAVAAMGERLGAAVSADEPAGGLNSALVYGAGVARSLLGPLPVACLTADLPALRPEELAAALALAQRHGQAFVADHTGEGTTLLCSTGLVLPHFGAGSAAAHRATGATELVAEWPGLRLDVDTVTDVIDIAQWGPGPATAALLDRMPSLQALP